MKTLLLVLALGLLFAVPAMAQWVEPEDAGNLPATAQIPLGDGPLVTIAGTITPGDVDMFCIMVTDPTTFVASTCGVAWDTQLFLFREDGIGVATDDDLCDPGLQSLINGFASCQYSVGPGTYYIAVSRYNVDPRDAAGAVIFSSSTGCATGAAGPVASWTASTSTAGDYIITLTSVNYCGTVATEGTTWGSLKAMYH
jgi:hypothetical protein